MVSCQCVKSVWMEVQCLQENQCMLLKVGGSLRHSQTIVILVQYTTTLQTKQSKT